jgi:hypothetical protein
VKNEKPQNCNFNRYRRYHAAGCQRGRFRATDASGAQGRGTGVPIDADLDEYMLAALADELGVSLDSLTAQYEAAAP